DRSVIESARGMGMTKTAVLFRIELPLAVPIMLAGIRTALVITVGTATLATFIGAGGLGALIETGITLNRTPVLIAGAALTAVLALFIDWLAGVAEDVLRPRGLQ
ncbi:MAG: ABC transporter permease subunit, partial [Actinomycetota bacterium]|nr:ABC transporter permease subunit [Actinomycetota bacterium]